MGYILWPPYDSPYNEFYDDKGRKQMLLDKIDEVNKRLKYLESRNMESDKFLLQPILGMQYGIVEVLPGIDEENIHPEGDCTFVVSINGLENKELEVKETFLDWYLDVLRRYFRMQLINFEEEFQESLEEQENIK